MYRRVGIACLKMILIIKKKKIAFALKKYEYEYRIVGRNTKYIFEW